MLAYRIKMEDQSILLIGGDSQESSLYKLSKDYTLLFQLVTSGAAIVCFVDYMWSKDVVSRDVALLCERNYRPRVRGISYGKMIEPSSTDLEAKFVENCQELRLEFIPPQNSEMESVTVKSPLEKLTGGKVSETE